MDVSITNVVRPVAVAVRVALVGEWVDGIQTSVGRKANADGANVEKAIGNGVLMTFC